MLWLIKRHQERVAGAVMVAIGGAALLVARTYPIGTLRQMGPGLFPVVLAALMIVLGVLIALANDSAPLEASEAPTHGPGGLERPEPRGWLCIIAGIASFIALAQPVGMLPATFACVFIAAMGDRTATWRGSALLAAGIAVAGTALFHYGLQIQLAPLHWPPLPWLLP